MLITGGSRGLGYALAQQLADAGVRLAVCARSAQELAVASAELRQRGADVLTMTCDVSDREQVQRMVEQATVHFGRIDVVINNAGIITGGPLASQTLEDFEQTMAINFWGSVYTTLAVLPQMRERRQGHIVNITSIGGKVSVPHLLSYSSAKFALVGFSEGLTAEVAKDGIVVTTVAPGLMRTGSYLNAIIKGDHQKEFTLFSLIDSLPLSSMSVESAARDIVRALQRGSIEVTLSPQAQIFALLHGIAPSLTINMLRLATRFLPDPRGLIAQTPRLGRDAQTRLSRSWLTRLNQRAAERYNQLGAPIGGHAVSEQTEPGPHELVSSI